MATLQDHIETIQRYLEGGCEPGSGTRAILENDLLGAVQRLDLQSQTLLVPIVKYLYNNVPMECWGSRRRVDAWIAQKRKAAAEAAAANEGN